MFTSTAGAEVANHSLQCRERCGAVDPDVRSVRFLFAHCQHLHWCFIGMDDVLGQYGSAKCIYQRLQLHTGMAHPLSQRRARDRQAGTGEDLFLPVQRKVVGKLGHHHVSQQAGNGDALVEHLCWHRRLSQYFALTAGPLATYMLVNRKHARGVIKLLADVFADALKLAAAGTFGALRLVANDSTRKLRRQRRTFGLLAWLIWCWGGTKCFQLGIDGFEVGAEQVIQQATLRRADLLTALGEFGAFKDSDLVRKLLDDSLVAAALSAQGSTFDRNCAASPRS